MREIDRARRVVVTGPRTRSAPRPTHRGVLDLDEQTAVGEVYLRSLIRVQLRLALTVCLVVFVVGGGLPLLFSIAPATRSCRVAGFELPWLVLGVGMYPALLAGGWAYVRVAERNERKFEALVERG